MAAIFKVRNSAGIITIDQDMLLCRYLTRKSIAWNDQSVQTITHDGFLQGTPFYHVVHPNRHDLNPLFPLAIGRPSYIECSFSGNMATFQQIWQVANEFRYIGRDPIIVHFGVFG